MVYALYTALTLILAWPSILHPARLLFAFHGDALSTLFWLWWFKTAWLRGLPAQPNPMVAAPFGAEWGPVIERGMVWPGILLSALVNETFAFNAMVLISFPLAAIATYHLVLWLTGSRTAGFVAGLIYSFCPYHLWKSWAWIPLSNIQWVPCYALALLNLRKRRHRQDAALAGFWFGVAFLSSYIYGFVLAVFTLLYGLFEAMYAYVTRGRLGVKKDMLLLGGVAGAVAAALVLPVAGPLVARTAIIPSEDVPYEYIWAFSRLYNLVATPSDYIFPSDFSPLRPLFRGIDPPRGEQGDFTHGLFIGYGVLAMMGFAIWGWWKELRKSTLKEFDRFAVLFFGVVFGAAMLLSITPPTLRLNMPGLGPVTIKGPGYFAYPLAPWFQEYAHFGVLVMLAAAVLAGFGVRYILRRWPNREWLLLGLLVLAVLGLDYSFHRPSSAAPIDTGYVPEVYRWLAEQPGDFIIAEYPFSRSDRVSPNYLFYITVHGKRLANGHGFSRRSNLLLPAILDLTDRQAPRVLSYLGVKYVIVHSTWPGFEHWYTPLPTPSAMTEDFEVVRRFDTATVLRLRAEPASVIVVPGDGFALAPDQTLRASWWWVSVRGKLSLVNGLDRPLDAVVHFTATASGGAKGLEVYLADGRLVQRIPLEGKLNRVAVGPLHLPPSHLRRWPEPEVVELILRVTGDGPEAKVGLRDFRVEEISGGRTTPH